MYKWIYNGHSLNEIAAKSDRLARRRKQQPWTTTLARPARCPLHSHVTMSTRRYGTLLLTRYARFVRSFMVPIPPPPPLPRCFASQQRSDQHSLEVQE